MVQIPYGSQIGCQTTNIMGCADILAIISCMHSIHTILLLTQCRLWEFDECIIGKKSYYG